MLLGLLVHLMEHYHQLIHQLMLIKILLLYLIYQIHHLSYIQQSTSYPAFDLEFFKDSNLTEIYDSNADDSSF